MTSSPAAEGRPEVARGFVVGRVLAAIREWNRDTPSASVTQVALAGEPFRVLVATILSLRTLDQTTEDAAARLFSLADTPETLERLDPETIERAIYPVGFYRMKARRLIALARTILAKHSGRVPRDMESLLALDGVGRKTANLVLTLGHGLPGICVDTHVHRITNRWGYVRTRSPDDTEAALRALLPRRYWNELNELLVTFGKTTCRPISPWCSRCPVAARCRAVGVGSRR